MHPINYVAGQLTGLLLVTVTEKSSKRFRFTLVSRMQNYTLDIIESLYLANEVFLNDEKSAESRLRHQRKAQT